MPAKICSTIFKNKIDEVSYPTDERYVDESKEMSILNNVPADSDRSDGEADD